MRRKQVWRYYCDFCKRAGCSAYHIQEHEKHCTNNPNRVCGFHSSELWSEAPQKPMAELIAALTSCGEDWADGMKALREAADNCPACIWAALKQSGVLQSQNPALAEGREDCPSSEEWERVSPLFDFDFKREVSSFWADVNADRSISEWYR